MQSIALAVTGTPVEFLYATNYNVGQNLQEPNYVQIASGTAPAGGLSLRVSSSSPNVLLSAVETAAGKQTMDITIVAGQSRSPIFYVQSLASTGTAQLTVQILTSPNPRYLPGPAVTVNLVPSGFEVISTLGSVVSNQYQLTPAAHATPTLMYIQAWALNPSAVANNRLQTQDVRGGYSINLPLSITNASIGELRNRVSNQPGNVITQLPIVAGEYYTYFYFDPSTAGTGTLNYTKPAGSGTPTVSGLPYLQSVAITVSP